MAAVVIFICAVFADHQNKIVSDQAAREEVLARVNLIRAKLEGNINGNLQLVRGLVATVMAEPYMGQPRFAALASSLFGEDSQLRNIAGAPDLVISLMYPIAGNEKAMGLDYRNDAQQRAAALRARDERKLILAGPVDLVQGGQGFIGRFPVFVKSAGNTERFWGIVSAVVDVQRLYEASGLFDKDLGIDIALIGKDALGAQGEQFFGDETVGKNNPVRVDVLLPSGSWQIAAIPENGWPTTPANAWVFRGIMAAAGALILIPFLVAGRLIGERQRNYWELERLSRRLELALEASAIGVWEHDLKTNDLMWDDRVNEIYGKPVDGKPRGYSDWAGAIHPDDLAAALADFDSAAAVGGPYSSEYRIVRPDGEIRHVRSKAIFYQAANNSPRMVGAEWDVTADVLLNADLVRARQLAESKNAELESARARIEHIALHDPLTGLPNRRYLDQVLEDYAANARLNGEHAALLHIDLDRFKQINDTLGHAAGDAMLVHASSVLQSNVGEQGFVARVGGDEFIILCRVRDDLDQPAVLADRIIKQMRQPVYYKGHQCRFGVSVGIAIDNGNDVEARQLLVNADIALYQAKSRGRNRREFFTGALQSEIINTKRIADEILNGLERNEFIVSYQPQFDAQTLDIVGVEALARWKHPEKGILAPDAFLKIAEELNVVSTIDRSVLKQSLSDFDEWAAENLGIPHVSVNVSAKRLQDEELIKNLRELKIKKGTVSFELVESIFLDENDDLVTWNVEQIKQLGIDVEIDDFGTGYASVISLLKLQPRRLKIDRQLVFPIVRSRQQRQLVSSIIEIGKSLGIEIVAEGVETMEHARLLKGLGCDVLQGYAFGRTLASDELKTFVRSRRLSVAS
ncbi:EAL domain-containing protein [Mesorhizobium sp. VK24D]|uniref:EAL domain-containing protein n=1 Tax=Mesorhizobium album TaxID=3072314 RepID=A0ABU4XUV4_9HYPH|nr:EAL domain-containing protein [Mesorhizobium sp. VK24D]MDX8477414.1 EAL domain-containing protein [Mesorhizobium sp. VK24D]